jgi:HSP20 family protein
LQIRVSNGVLDVKGTRTPPGPDLPRGSCYAERPFGAFQRLIPIPEDAAADRIQAQLKDGVLTIKVPRLGPSSVEAKDIVVN